MPTTAPSPYRVLFTLPVIACALGFFVDVYDLLIFNIVRVPSLESLGLTKAQISTQGAYILYGQQAGLLVGGILWGIIGDKRGRLAVLFGSIVTYSLANLACGLVQSVPVYAVLRFVAGVGLSGELGAAMVLVAEIVPKAVRSYGSSVVAGIGYLGALAAYLTQEFFDWRTAFFVGGGMGLALLVLRASVFESGLFEMLKTEQSGVERGNFLTFFRSWPNARKYLRCVAVGLPTWFVVGILATFSNEFGEVMGIAEPVKPGQAVMMIYVGLAAGDLLSGPFSQWLRSRRWAIGWLLLASAVLAGVFLFGGIRSAQTLYLVCSLAGFCTGYVAMYLTMVAEQYGTNLRATATTSVPSIVRGLVIPMTLLFQALKPAAGTLVGAGLLGLVVYALAFWSLSRMEETFGNELAFVEG